MLIYTCCKDVKIKLTYGGCYDIAKRTVIQESKMEKVTISLPTVMLKTLNKNVPIECISKFIQFDPYSPLPSNYKIFYGIRFVGMYEKRPMFYGFDMFYQITGSGLDLEKFLEFCFTNNFHIDWYNFQRSSKERGKWSFETLIKKLIYPVMEIYGKEYWENLEKRFLQYEQHCYMQEKKK